MSDEQEPLADRSSILGAKVRRYMERVIQGKRYRFQSLNEREFSDYNARIVHKDGGLDTKKVAQQHRRLIVMTLVDDKGTRILMESDLAALEEVDGGLTSELYEAAADHCGIGRSKVADHEKNSSETSDDGSRSG